MPNHPQAPGTETAIRGLRPGIRWQQSLEARVAFWVVIFAALPLAILLPATSHVITSRSLDRSTEEFEGAENVVAQLTQERARALSAQCRLLATRTYIQAYITDSVQEKIKDQATVDSLTEQARQDLAADVTVITYADGQQGMAGLPGRTVPPALRTAILRSAAGQSYQGIANLGSQLYIVVVEPLRFAEETRGTVLGGFRLDDQLALSLARATRCQVSFVSPGGCLSGSSLQGAERDAISLWLLHDEAGSVRLEAEAALRTIGNRRYVSGVYPFRLAGPSSGRLALVQSWAPVQQYLDDVLRALIATALATLGLALLGGLAFSRRISRPLRDLAEAAEEIAAGQWSRRAPERGTAEAVAMASAFNHMTGNLVHWYQEARDLASTLERRVEARTAQLHATNQELEAFSYSVSHDLRAPLRAIDGFSRAIIEDYSESIDPQGKRLLERVRAGATRMGQMIEDLLSLSQTTRGPMDRTAVDLSEVCREVLAELRDRAPDREVTTLIEPGMVCEVDPRLLRTALENLLGNAWKYTVRTASPCIEVGRTGPEFFVRDNGAGFDMALVHRLFGAFQRLHTDAEFEGSGIGLATVRRIIHRHGGEIRAEGAVGQGATFYFTLSPPEG